MLISEAVHVWREPDGEYHVEWEATEPDTRVIVEPLAQDDALRVHYSEAPAGRVRLTGLPPATRHYFRVRDHLGNEIVVTERRLGLQGTPNFRDFGGYPTADGRRVKWGYLYRSGQLSSLSDQDIDLLATLDLDLVCDFRRAEEQLSDPSRLPGLRPPRVASLPIIPGSNSRFLEEAEHHLGDRQAMFDFMVDINRDFAEGQIDTYARMFREILALEDARFLVHCAAGKDRTGFAAALVLLALGVPREVVMQDYLLTGRFFKPDVELDRLRQKYQMDGMDVATILPMLEVHRDYLERALDAIAENYGSVEDYLSEALGVGAVELEELRRRYLE
jgi:protein-tyrosine phosphatase